jgi:hypothetical protein
MHIGLHNNLQEFKLIRSSLNLECVLVAKKKIKLSICDKKIFLQFIICQVNEKKISLIQLHPFNLAKMKK